MADLKTDLQDYWSGLRFFPHNDEIATTRLSDEIDKGAKATDETPKQERGASLVYCRANLHIDAAMAKSATQVLGVDEVLKGWEHQIISPSAHFYAPAHSTIPMLLAFRYNPEHEGNVPLPQMSCLLKPMYSFPVSKTEPPTTLEVVPEVQVWKSPDPDHMQLFQQMLQRECAEHNAVMWDSKAETRPLVRPGTHTLPGYDNSSWSERSNIGLIPVIVKGQALRDKTTGEILLAPIIIDSGCILPLGKEGDRPMEGQVKGIDRKDLQFKSVFTEKWGFDYKDIKEKTKDFPTLNTYIKDKTGLDIDLSYGELIDNYTKALQGLSMVKRTSESPAGRVVHGF